MFNGWKGIDNFVRS